MPGAIETELTTSSHHSGFTTWCQFLEVREAVDSARVTLWKTANFEEGEINPEKCTEVDESTT